MEDSGIAVFRVFLFKTENDMKKLSCRRMILLGLIAVLLCVYIVQLAFRGKNNVKTLAVAEDVTKVVVAKSTGNIVVQKTDGLWYVGDEKFPAQENRALGLANSVGEIKTLGTVTSSSDDERYGFTESETIKVEAFAGDKLVRTLEIGKNTATGSQSYVKIDGKSNVLLAQGNLRSTFEVSVDDIKIKEDEKKDDVEAQSNESSEIVPEVQ